MTPLLRIHRGGIALVHLNRNLLRAGLILLSQRIHTALAEAGVCIVALRCPDQHNHAGIVGENGIVSANGRGAIEPEFKIWLVA